MLHEMHPRKVLMILESCYPTEGGGGAENQVRTISRYLHERGVAVEIIAPMTREAPAVEYDEVDGVAVWRIPYPQVRWFGGFFMLFRLAAYLVRHRAEYDVIHAHIAHNMAAMSSAVGRLLGKIVIIKLTGWLEIRHGILAPGWHPVMALKRMALRSASYIQATSTQIRNRLLERGFDAGQVHVIPNAVDIGRFARASSAAMTATYDDNEPLTLIFVGRLVPEKGLDTLLDAWTAAFSETDNVRLIMVGDGYLRESIEAQVRAAGREHQVQLAGPRSDIAACLTQAHVGVLPSLYEGLSNTLLEYMAAGLPVLGTRVSGTEDFIEHGLCGWLVDAGDTAAITECLREIARMDRAQLAALGEAARQRVSARASIDAVIAQLAGLYDIEVAIAGVSRSECT